MSKSPIDLRGFKIYQSILEPARQMSIVNDIRRVVQQAPMLIPRTPSGRKMSVRMTSAGKLGWITDTKGYRYEGRHPNGVAWPPIPKSVLDVWWEIASCEREPDSCLVNLYREGARMGMHRDADEVDFRCPVVSISLGDDGLLRIGNLERGGQTESIWLGSGDAVVMGGDARLRYHGIDKIKFGSSQLLPSGGRLNLTLRVAA